MCDHGGMQEGKLTHAWVQAEAALPLEWILMGVVRGPRDAEALMPAGIWTAWAKGPREGQEAAGTRVFLELSLAEYAAAHGLAVKHRGPEPSLSEPEPRLSNTCALQGPPSISSPRPARLSTHGR